MIFATNKKYEKPCEVCGETPPLPNHVLVIMDTEPSAAICALCLVEKLGLGRREYRLK